MRASVVATQTVRCGFPTAFKDGLWQSKDQGNLRWMAVTARAAQNPGYSLTDYLTDVL